MRKPQPRPRRQKKQPNKHQQVAVEACTFLLKKKKRKDLRCKLIQVNLKKLNVMTSLRGIWVRKKMEKKSMSSAITKKISLCLK